MGTKALDLDKVLVPIKVKRLIKALKVLIKVPTVKAARPAALVEPRLVLSMGEKVFRRVRNLRISLLVIYYHLAESPWGLLFWRVGLKLASPYSRYPNGSCND